MVASAFGDGVDGFWGVHFWFIGGVGGVLGFLSSGGAFFIDRCMIPLPPFFLCGIGQAGSVMSHFALVLSSIPTVILTVLLIIMVVGSLDTTMGAMDFGAEGNDTRDDIFTNTWNALSITPIIPLILIASIVLGSIGLLRLGGFV